MNVELIAFSPDPEKVVAAAAKLCYSPSSAQNILDGLNEENTASYLNMIMSLGHESPIEHISFTFAVEGVSRSLLAQFTRHRIASYSVKSQRYVNEGKFEFVIPPQIEADVQAKEIYLKAMDQDTENYNKLADILKEKYLQAGVPEGKAEKQAIEDARYVLPNACETKMIVTMNARSLLNFFQHRCCERAQWEIRQCADKMLELAREKAPSIFKNAGPSCVSGACPEGKMSCGKINEKRIKYAGR